MSRSRRSARSRPLRAAWPALPPGALLAFTVLLGCEPMPEELERIDDDTVEPAPDPGVGVPVCEGVVPAFLPEDGAGPLASRTPLEVRWSGAVDDVVFLARDRLGRAVAGTSWIDREAAFFVPRAPWPAGEVSWSVAVCGAISDHRFEAGNVVRPLRPDELGGLEGPGYSFDLRVADWRSPEPRAGEGPLLAAQLGGAFFVRFFAAKADSVVVALTPAVPDLTGFYVADLCREQLILEVALDDNPYLTLPLETLSLAVSGGEVTVRDVELAVGLTPDGPRDGRLAGELDLRAARPLGGATGCELLEAATWDFCRPCQSDGEVACVPLHLTALDGLGLLDLEAASWAPAGESPGAP